MAIWIQSLSWTLIYGVGQGFVVFTSLWLLLKVIPATRSNTKYHLSLSALTILLCWFIATWWHQFHILAQFNEQSLVTEATNTTNIQWRLSAAAIENYSGCHFVLLYVQRLSPWFSAFYVIGLALMLIRLSGGMLQLFSLRTKDISQADAKLNETLAVLKQELYMKRGVQLLISAKAQVPIVIGFLKPVILVPAAVIAQVSTQQLEMILLHELAHIRRNDYLVNILQTVAETILFFNPFVWLVSGIVRKEREHCCDDLVLQHITEPFYYATALAALATDGEDVTAFAVAASGQSHHLFNRIKRIMEMKKNRFSYSRMVAAIFIITTITCSVALLAPSFAKTKRDKVEKVNTSPAGQSPALDPETLETNQLVQQLIADRVVSEAEGFVVEKKQDQLIINGQPLAADIAARYLRNVKQTDLRVQVFSFRDRLQMHPDAGIMELVMPVMSSSGCVKYSSPKKPGC